MATISTIPQMSLAAGEHDFGPFNVASNVSQYVITLNQISWPNAGDLAFDYSCDVSQDNGQTWATVSSGNVFDNAIPAKFGNPAGQFKIVCDIPGVGNNKRDIRFASIFAKTLTISGTLAAN